MRSAAYAPHAIYVAPARPTRQLGKLLIGILAVEFLFSLGIAGLGLTLGAVSPRLAEVFFTGGTGGGLILQLTAFALLALALRFVMLRQHHRGLRTALGDPVSAAVHLIAALTGVAVLFLAIEILPPWWSLHDTHRQNLAVWLITLPVACFAILIQTSAEELLYRGYIQQQLAARFSTPLIWLTLPNLLFAAAHWDNGATALESGRYVVWAFCFGIAASDLTARTGNLGAAIGMHFANNAYALLFFAEADGPDSGLALFLYSSAVAGPAPLPDAGPLLSLPLLVEIAVVALSWLAVRIAVRR